MTLKGVVEFKEAVTGQDFSAARALFTEYTDSLGVDLSFQNYPQELKALETLYMPPAGALLLARQMGSFVGCVGLKKLDATSCEMKRLYVKPENRRSGLGRALCERIIEKGKQLGYKRMKLDTLPSMPAAQALYRELGFRAIAPYYDNPIPGTRYMELVLK